MRVLHRRTQSGAIQPEAIVWARALTLVVALLSGSKAHAQFHHVDSCLVCHDMFAQSNLYYIRDVIQTPNSGPKPVVYTSLTGHNSLADGDAIYDGVCEVCHTQNGHHHNDGSDNTEHFDGQRCTQCHLHYQNEFSAPYPRAHKTHVVADKGPHIVCADCHSSPLQFKPTVFADGQGLATTAVCDGCHSPWGTYDGVNDPDHRGQEQLGQRYL